MHKTIRILLALLPTLCTACTSDDPATTPATDTPLVLEHVYIGTPTKAEPIQWDGFREGDQLKATLTLNGVTSEGTYTYKDGTWDTPTPAYWQDPTEAHTLTLRTPEPTDPMPDAFTDDTWHTYDILTYTGTATPGTTSYPLTHTCAQLCVTLTAGETMTGADLTNATIKVNDCGMLHQDGAYYALLDPDATPTLTITYEGDTYTYTPETDILTAGKCTMLTLTLNKTGVSGITTTGEEWQNVTGTVTEVEGWNTHTGGNIDPNTLTGKVLITGMLNSADITAIKGATDKITDLYITATVSDNAWQSFNMGSSISLRSVYLAQFTQLWMLTFNNCKALTTVSLPKVTSIDGEAFSGCTSLTTVYLPKITNIAYSIFDGCSSLKEITLSKSTNINESPSGQGAFADCTALTTLRLPDLDAADFNEDTYASFGGVDWQHIYYNGGAWHRDENN